MPAVPTVTVLQEPVVGSILHICFRGDYPHGSLGNSTAKEMVHSLTSAISDFAPAAVIVDLTDLKYRWGDAICQIAMPLRRNDESFIPACIVASGETAEALTPLVGPGWLLGIAGVKLVASFDDAFHNLATRGG